MLHKTLSIALGVFALFAITVGDVAVYYFLKAHFTPQVGQLVALFIGLFGAFLAWGVAAALFCAAGGVWEKSRCAPTPRKRAKKAVKRKTRRTSAQRAV